jgi:hypothetical protein
MNPEKCKKYIEDARRDDIYEGWQIPKEEAEKIKNNIISRNEYLLGLFENMEKGLLFSNNKTWKSNLFSMIFPCFFHVFSMFFLLAQTTLFGQAKKKI